MVEGVSKTFDAVIKDFLIQAQVYKEDLEGLLDRIRAEDDYDEDTDRVQALEEAIELVEQAIDAVEALPD